MREQPRVKMDPVFIEATAKHAYETLGHHIDANFETQGRSLSVQWYNLPAECRAAWAATIREVTGELLTELQRLGHLKEGLHV